MKKVFTILILLISSITITKASTYTPDTDLFENTYTNNLIDMAYSQIDNFSSKVYAILRVSDNYYLISSEEALVNGNQITMNNTVIIQAIRTQENYSYYYTYNTIQENETIINVNNIIVSNIETSKSVSSKRYDEYKHNVNITNIGIFVLGLLFAIFVTKERSY